MIEVALLQAAVRWQEQISGGPWISALEVLGQELVQAMWWGGLARDNIWGVKQGVGWGERHVLVWDLDLSLLVPFASVFGKVL